MSMKVKEYHYPLRLNLADAKAVDEVCRESRVSFNRVVALCVKRALPDVRETLGAHAQRITNVDPLPKKTAKRLYSQPDDDVASIRKFMAAQVTDIEE